VTTAALPTRLPAIDAHGHYGIYIHSNALLSNFSSGSAAEVAQRAKACGVTLTIVSPLAGLLPRGRGQAVVAANEAAHSEIRTTPGLLQYVIVNPLQPETYDQARRMLRTPWCVGIKVHPEEHSYRISDHGDALFAFFEETGVPVKAHSGCPNSLPDDFLPFANRFPRARVMLAHLGNGTGADGRLDLQVRALQAARHGNLWIDTSSARSILPGLVEWAVREVGAERLLFGSDTPLYHVAMQRERIDCAEIAAADKERILFRNAYDLFNLELRLPNGVAESKHA
jgi:predicted TIM-barrel fold metal-dependent hydrolase